MIRDIVIWFVFGLSTYLAEAAHAGQHAVFPHAIDSTQVGVDTIPPSRPVFHLTGIRRGVGPRDLGNGTMTFTSVDDFAGATFVPECTDDRSKPFEIGYRVEYVAGMPPEQLTFSDRAYRAMGCGRHGKTEECQFVLHWIEEPRDYQPPFDFTIVVTAIDRAGNESEPSEAIRVFDEGRAREPDLTKAIDEIALQALQRGPIAGISVAVCRKYMPVHVRGYGFAIRENKRYAGIRTSYDIASVTQTFTALQAMCLIDAGVLSLDDPIATYLPDFPNPEQGSRITIGHLLNHTSGLADYGPDGIPAWTELSGESFSAERVIDFLDQLPLAFEPGTQWSYSNTNYHLLARIIGRMMDQSYASWVWALTGFHGLGLNSVFLCEDGMVRHPARGYRVDQRGGLEPADRHYQIPCVAGDGGLCATVEDLAFLPLRTLTGRTVDPTVIETVLMPTGLPSGIEVDYGTGVRLGSLDGHRFWGNVGGSGPYVSAFAHYPDDSLTIAVLINTINAREDALAIEGDIARAALGLDDPALEDRSLSPADLKRYAGRYENANTIARVYPSGGRLMWKTENINEAPRVLRYQGSDEFSWKERPSTRIRFHVDGDRIVGISEYDQGMFMTFYRPGEEE